MIFTCTMNPSLDYYMEFDKKLSAHVTNRSSLEYYEAGGKGINVSIVLNNLGIPSSAFGFIGGFTKDFYVTLLAKYEEIRPLFTYTHGHTRINVKCSADGSTDLNAAGPVITHEDMQNLIQKVSRCTQGDYLVLAGVTQEYLQDDVIAMLKDCMANGVKIILDTNPYIINSLLPCNPFLIKANSPLDLGALFDETPETLDEVVALGKRVIEAGAEHLIVILDNEKALLFNKDGAFESVLVNADQVVNFVGTGDSMVAGFLMNYLRTKDAIDSFRFGASCGIATMLTKGLATRGKIDSFYETTAVEKIA